MPGGSLTFERDPVEVERLASDLIELSTRQKFAPFLRRAAVLRGWARSASGETAEGVLWIENGIEDFRATGSILDMPFLTALRAEALYLADRTSDALEAIAEVEELIERFENRYWCAELHRLKGVFLTAMGADKTEIEASFCAAIRIGKKPEVDFVRETRRSNLRKISLPKSERVRRSWIPTTSLLTPKREIPKSQNKFSLA